MTVSLETVRRLHAWASGGPTPRGEVVNVHVAAEEDLLITAFLRMGGESRPWGIAIGTLADGPTIFTVPEGRNRDLVGDMMVKAADVLLSHFNHPRWSDSGPSRDDDVLRQIWLPGQTHVDMLQYLAATYARTKWNRDDVDTLRAVGNLCNALFIETQRPGEQTVISATEALRTCYVFPTAQSRQGHVGHLLGWLTGGKTLKSRLDAAVAAANQSMATVINPDEERGMLEPLVDEWTAARRRNDGATMMRADRKIHRVLETHLLARWEATATAARLIHADPREYNEGLDTLCVDSIRQMFDSWGDRAMREEAGEIPYWPNVFTDRNAREVGSAFQRRIAQDEKARHLLTHGDRELQREELAAGHGVICTVTRVRGDGMWTTQWSFPDLPTLKEGDTLSIAGNSNAKLKVVDVDLDSETLMLAPDWKLAKKNGSTEVYTPADPRWKGKTLVLLDSPAFGLAERKAKTARRNFGPDDITALLANPSTRHAAYDEEGRLAEVAPEIEGAL